jgi:hypothetical protein
MDSNRSTLSQRALDWYDKEQVENEYGINRDSFHLFVLGLIDELTGAEDWIKVEDSLPEGECLAIYVTPAGKRRMIRAKYARQFQIEAEGDDCETEYNEDDDTFYIKAGWLECIDNWGEYSSCYVVEGAVTHWKRLPAPPSD